MSDAICSICNKPFQRVGRQKYCGMECTLAGARLSWNKYSAANRTKKRAYQKSYYRDNREKVLLNCKRYTNSPAGRITRKKIDLKQKVTNPEKVKARTAVMVALRMGVITRKHCEDCGKAKTQAHHTDYSKPLEIVWLCQLCHDLRHGKTVALEAIK